MNAQLFQSGQRSGWVAIGWPRGNGQIVACPLYHDSGTSATRERCRNGYSANSTLVNSLCWYLAPNLRYSGGGCNRTNVCIGRFSSAR